MSARNRYLEFCRKANLKPLPLCQGTLCLFAAFLHQEGLAPKSVSLYLSAVRHMEVEATASSSPRSEWPFLQYVVKRSSTAPGGTGQLPITREIMLWLKQSWCNPGDHLHVLLWATACIAFFGFLRLGEVTAVPNGPPPILMSGVAIDSHSKPTMIKLTLGRTKSDPFGTGTTVYLGKTGVQLCPVQAVLGYLAVRPPAQQGPLLVTRDGGPLSRECFVQHLKTALTALGVDHRRYSGHSFRIGAATSAAQAGIPDHLIKAMGRWRSEAYQIYIRTPPATLASVSSSLATGTPP